MPPGSPTVLVIDDDPSVRAYLTEAVRVGGYDAVVADEPMRVLELLRAGQRPDLVLCDVDLPGMSGFELQRHSEQIAPGTRFVFISAHQDDHPAIMADEGRHNIVRKPARIGEILMALALALEQ
jgi:CheY-like chemotaxis protein